MKQEVYDASKEFDVLAEEYDDTLQEVVGSWVGETEKFAEYKVQLLQMIVSGGQNLLCLILGVASGVVSHISRNISAMCHFLVAMYLKPH